ncbi:hypothetical protein AC1031_022022 [Aphanomyces cochlioides]|nr:hypothetical protein AC1031_022022 [Aphanomyces cochlioides]
MTSPTIGVEAIRDACIATQTRAKYKSSLNGIKKWIENVLSQSEADTARFIGSDGDIDLAEFTPHYFERFLAYKRTTAKISTLSGYRSAIKDLYRVQRIALPPEYGPDMTQFFSGMKRLEAEHDQTSTPKLSGKQPLTYSLYITLCKRTLGLSDGGFAHLFLTS